MKSVKKLICFVFGHNYICVFRNHFKWPDEKWAETVTVHECQRCKKITENIYQRGV